MKLVPVLIAALVQACSSQSSSSQSLDPQALISTLSSAEAVALCDRLAGLYGGYGRTFGCDAGPAVTISGPPDQATCVSQYLEFQLKYKDCPATIAQVESCSEWLVKNVCMPGTPRPSACDVTSSHLCSN
jgi:hypothetical protein